MSDSVRAVVQCHGHTNAGHRCKRRTARTSYCYAHLDKELHLKVKKSNIPGAGMGLFTTVKRRKYEKLAPYDGERVVSHDPDYGGKYVLQVKEDPPTFINARKTTGTARWANDGRNPRRNNSNFKVYHHRVNGVVQADGNLKSTRPIQANREILADYGRDYNWDN